MIRKILHFRFVLIIVVFFLLVNSLAFIVVGVVSCIHGYAAFFNSGFDSSEHSRPGIHLLEGLDSFMVAIIFMIFGAGIARIFLFPNISNESDPGWLKLNNLKDLKVLLWETILLTLVIFSVVDIVSGNQKTLEMLIYPGVILILTISLFLMRKEH